MHMQKLQNYGIKQGPLKTECWSMLLLTLHYNLYFKWFLMIAFSLGIAGVCALDSKKDFCFQFLFHGWTFLSPAKVSGTHFQIPVTSWCREIWLLWAWSSPAQTPGGSPCSIKKVHWLLSQAKEQFFYFKRNSAALLVQPRKTSQHKHFLFFLVVAIISLHISSPNGLNITWQKIL